VNATKGARRGSGAWWERACAGGEARWDGNIDDITASYDATFARART